MSNPSPHDEFTSFLRASEDPYLRDQADDVAESKPTASEYKYTADILIIGSGPIACTYARFIHEKLPKKTIIMVEAGSQDYPVIGGHHKNAIKYQKTPEAFVHYIKAALDPVSVPPTDPYLPTLPSVSWTSLNDPYVAEHKLKKIFPQAGQNENQQEYCNLPAAAMTKTVGGMASHWTCACLVEEPLYLKDKEKFESLLKTAQGYLNVHSDEFDISLRHNVVKDTLTSALGKDRVINIPLAVQRSKTNVLTWSGADTILGKDINFKTYNDQGKQPDYMLLPETMAVFILSEKIGTDKLRTANAVRVKNLKTNKSYSIGAKQAIVVACGAIGTPQLLSGSYGGYSIESLGRYLSEQSVAFCQIVLKESIVKSIRTNPKYKTQVEKHDSQSQKDPIPIPFDDLEPQVMLKYKNGYIAMIDRSAFFAPGTRPEVDPRVTFETYRDKYGMRQATFDVSKSNDDKERENQMIKDMNDIASYLGGFIPGSSPQIMPPGLALHITGTTRIGTDETNSVASPESLVHGFKNLWIGGNGCIPDSTACNPTLTSVAIAIHGAESLVDYLK
ncbi:hypothetical protein BT96DRAFT_1024457 [Gymnopus androsaceus JB14]|uniref:Glucose-methanol-choline oxidoreductase C-terminal domain-containing protein n=1 Tax=Gymnopus androsaceus JB14 TaxID=1447944 RepID=A0A6A4GZR4_9AGAR|nr:hypothetical protein BT96DRAFT_1024457 [Gymnopus androsaceus JB14]